MKLKNLISFVILITAANPFSSPLARGPSQAETRATLEVFNIEFAGKVKSLM